MKRRSLPKRRSRGSYTRKIKSPSTMMYGPRKHAHTHGGSTS